MASLFSLHHPCAGEGEVVLTGTANDDVVQDAHADILQRLHDLVGRVDVLFGRVTLLSGVKPCRHDTELHEDVWPRCPPSAAQHLMLVDDILIVCVPWSKLKG